MSSRALVLAPFLQDALDDLQRILPVAYESWTSTRKLYSPDELSNRINADGIEILMVEADFVFEEVFGDVTALKFLGVCRNSLDHIDLESATKHGVVVVNVPGRNAQGVAELTMGLLISMARRIVPLNRYVHGGDWENPVEPYISMRGVELHGKTLGLIGLGSIGRRVARLANAFGMNVVAYDPYVGTPGRKKATALLMTLDQLVGKSDFVSIHTSETSETDGLLDRRHLSQMKPGCYIVNTASYRTIDEDALVDGLRSGHIAGIALDVHPSHPIPPDSPLLGLDNVMLTPHIAGATDGTVERQSWSMVEDIKRYMAGVRPRNIVNRSVWRRRG